MAGLEVDGVEPAAPPFSGVVVGRVLEVERHPDADKLRVCRVDVDRPEPVQIVCGASNVRAGMRVPAALPGAELPGHVGIEATELRGVSSHGMLCSARELGLGDAPDGLMELSEDAPVGSDLRQWLALDDSIIEIDLTPNRGDCLSIQGVAREVHALTEADLRVIPDTAVPIALDESIAISIADPDACPRYAGRVIRDLNPSARTPDWMKERLRRGGIRSTGIVVDVTNYVMLELGQPMHAFDLERLKGSLQVRFARAEEPLVLLDGREVSLSADVLVIADQSGPVAVAGIMGGSRSSVGENTTSVFLESASFSPKVVLGRARRLGLHTDSSHRFERGVDPALQCRALERATSLLLQIAGGKAGPVVLPEGTTDLGRGAEIKLRRSRLDRILGFVVDDEAVDGILRRLQMPFRREGGDWYVESPPHRYDIAIEADLIEEIVRVHGYERLFVREPMTRFSMPRLSEQVAPQERIKEVFVQRGYHEVVTYSFVDPKIQRYFPTEGAPLDLANPISSELAQMRTGLWPGLISTLIHNLSRQQNRVRLFEIGLVFSRLGGNILQRKRIGGLAFGPTEPEQWGQPEQQVDFFHIKGDLAAIWQSTGRRGEFRTIKAEHPALHPGQCAQIVTKGEHPVGWLGTLHPKLVDALELPQSPVLFEFDCEIASTVSVPAHRPVSRYPSVRRDIAVIVSSEIASAALVDAVREALDETLVDLVLFDAYQGKGIESGSKSIALGLIFQKDSRTLEDQEVDAYVARAVNIMNSRFDAKIRE